MIAVPASRNFSPAAAFFRSSGELFLPRTKFMPGKTPSSIRFSPCTFPRRRLFNLQVRAARAESSVASLGSRAPYFELPEPLTGKVWKLDDFDSYPALLVKCPIYLVCMHSLGQLFGFWSSCFVIRACLATQV
ncbi:hypothetical protein MA16_Dca015387 [Dendrobium catenatum]|uniref:Uncharacterized protein n=2 Tax=Dendrobium catenatum TaxID=906689 RepID=A0A2I0VBR3_9ASPA|nr:hypothetical protein MA16_Dca015387 [Dendrobium catenatum]